eukprot:TRINITY_DN2527_c0_g1_i1.p2 TRINITY_DN2527_c0_g1~~TRINITY_DN2527_c0_g1_i1.p2  ORF type:complete len:50 (-),score=0.28 TRINITY_DN2527_c0_g1_i1:87-236(-)
MLNVYQRCIEKLVECQEKAIPSHVMNLQAVYEEGYTGDVQYLDCDTEYQ